MGKDLGLLCLTVVLPLGFNSVALAQSSDGAPYELSGTSISGTSNPAQRIMTAPVGPGGALKFENGLHLYPSVSTNIGYNDNLLSDNSNSLKSSYTDLASTVVGELKHKGDRYTALASINARRYIESAADNINDSQLVVAADNYYSARARSGLALGLVNSSDARGSNNRPVTAEVARWHSTNFNGTFIYGAPEAPGRVEFDVGNQDKVYDNERAITAVGDVDTGSYAGRVFYRLGTRSLALAEFRDAKANYGSSPIDSNIERRYYVGLTWEATAATTGIVKIGQMTKDFDQGGRQGYSGGSWEATVRWLPLTYSAVDFQASRTTADATGFGNYNLVTNTSIIWNHKWNQSLGSRLMVGLMDTEFGGTPRQDSAVNFGIKVDYAIRRWLKVGVDFARTDNTSNYAAYEYKRNIAMLTLEATL